MQRLAFVLLMVINAFHRKKEPYFLEFILDSARNFRVHIGWSHLIRSPLRHLKEPLLLVQGTLILGAEYVLTIMNATLQG